MKTTREQVLEIAAQCLELPAAQVRLDAPWEEYGGDSLAVVEMVLTVQEHFQISLETAELGELKSLNDLVRMVEQKLTR